MERQEDRSHAGGSIQPPPRNLDELLDWLESLLPDAHSDPDRKRSFFNQARLAIRERTLVIWGSIAGVRFIYEGFPSVEIRISGPETAAFARAIVHPDRVFSLVVEYPLGSDGEVESLAEPFFNSLRIWQSTGAKE